jgi:hypothetical protein
MAQLTDNEKAMAEKSAIITEYKQAFDKLSKVREKEWQSCQYEILRLREKLEDRGSLDPFDLLHGTSALWNCHDLYKYRKYIRY